MIGYILNGKLQMTDDQTGEFEILTDSGDAINVSRIINNLFESSLRPQVYIKISCGTSLLFEEDGLITFCTDNQKVESFWVCGVNLSKILWDNTDKFLELIIKQRKQKGK